MSFIRTINISKLYTIKELFNKLAAHLKAANLYPDELFFAADKVKRLPSGIEHIICDTHFGDSGGICLEVSIMDKNLNHELIVTGKIFGETADDFYKMARIGAEISLLINGNGSVLDNTRDQNARKFTGFTNGDSKTLYQIVERNKFQALLKRQIAGSLSDPTPYIVVTNPLINRQNLTITWDCGEYFRDIRSAVDCYSPANLEKLVIPEAEDEIQKLNLDERSLTFKIAYIANSVSDLEIYFTDSYTTKKLAKNLSYIKFLSQTPIDDIINIAVHNYTIGYGDAVSATEKEVRIIMDFSDFLQELYDIDLQSVDNFSVKNPTKISI